MFTLIMLLSCCCIISYGQTSIMPLQQNIYATDGTIGISHQQLYNSEQIALNTIQTVTETADRIAHNSFSLLAVEFEEEQEIEEWMLESFVPQVAEGQLYKLINQEVEKEQEIEDWMVNLNLVVQRWLFVVKRSCPKS